jgi:Bacteriophage head to tail connecting protein
MKSNAVKKDPYVAYEHASASLLAEQVSDAKDEKEIDSKAWQRIRGKLEQRLNSLYAWRTSWWMQNWSDLARFILPRRSIWLTQTAGGMPTPNNMTRGREINQAIADPTATYAVRVCAGGLMSGLASPSRPWFKVIPAVRKAALDTAAREWLDEVESRIYTVLASSNFYNSFAQECEDLVVFGTGPSVIYEDEKDLIRLYNPAVGEYFLGSDATLRVNCFYRRFLMTIEQLVGFFEVDNCPKEIQQLWEQKGTALQMERIVAHSIEPNYALGDDDLGVVPGNFAWREVYWVFGANAEKPLSMRGFVDQPFTAARWSTQSNDAYGRSPGMDVLPDVAQLQVMTMRMAEAIEKHVRPPLLADMQLKNQPSSILPGHVTYVANLGAQTGMRSIYNVNPDINAMAANIAAIEQRIKVGLFNDLFLMLENSPASGKMTAYEVAQKMQEKLSVLGPIIEGLLTESLKPKLKRVFGILQRKGMLSEPPDSLKGVPLTVDFVSVLALAAKAAATGGIERLMAFVGNLVAVDPSVKDNVNFDEAVIEMNEMLGNPQKLLRAPDKVAAIRQQAAQQQATMQKMQMLQHGAQTAQIGAKAAQVLSDTDVGAGGDALSMMLGKGA